MKKIVSVFLLLISVFSVRGEVVGEFDIYLMIGQSNMAGRGEFLSCDTTDIVEGVYLLNSEGIPEEARAPFNQYSSIRKDIKLQGYSPAIKFSETMHKQTGRKILIVSNARGGSSLDHWLPEDKHSYLNEAVRRTREAMRHGELKGIAWHQGETNIQKGISGYPEKFVKFITALRDSLGEGDIPVVIGQVGRWNWAPEEDIRIFNDSIIPELSEMVKNCRYVSSEGLRRRYAENERDPHFGRDAQIELGRRYAEAMTELINSGKGANR